MICIRAASLYERLEEADRFFGAEMVQVECFSQYMPHRFQSLNPRLHLNQLLLSKHSPTSWKLVFSLLTVQHEAHFSHSEPRFLRDLDESQSYEDLSHCMLLLSSDTRGSNIRKHSEELEKQNKKEDL
jgi:hypothetical protein